MASVVLGQTWPRQPVVQPRTRHNGFCPGSLALPSSHTQNTRMRKHLRMFKNMMFESGQKIVPSPPPPEPNCWGAPLGETIF